MDNLELNMVLVKFGKYYYFMVGLVIEYNDVLWLFIIVKFFFIRINYWMLFFFVE